MGTSLYLQLVDLILTNDVFEVNDVLVLESREDFDLSEGPLTERLVFEGSHFFDGNFLSTYAAAQEINMLTIYYYITKGNILTKYNCAATPI